MKTKKDRLYSFDHTRKRLAERYNVEINAMDYAEMCERIIHKKNVLFITSEKQKNDIQQIYDILFKGTTIRVVWSTSNKWIKTALPV